MINFFLSRRIGRLVSASILIPLTIGCGGALASGPGISLSASAGTIAYGQQVTIRWSSRQILSINPGGSNFPIGLDTLNGSLADTPAFDTTYIVEAMDVNGKTQSSRVTVKVTPSKKKILLVGDSSQAGVPQIVEYLQGITSQPVAVSQTLPSAITADLVVLLESGSIGVAQRTPIRTFLTSGGKVVFVGKAAPLVASGDPDSHDVSSIGSFLGGASTFDISISEVDGVNTKPAGAAFSAVFQGDEVLAPGGLSPVSTSAIRFTTGDIVYGFGYKPGIGGRVGFAGDAPIDGSGTSEAMRGVFLSICRWALDGS